MDPWSVTDLMPAAWVSLVSGLLLACLAHWYDRVPWRVASVFALAVGLLYGEVLAGGSVLLPLDNLRGQAPFRELAPAEPHGNLLQGDLVLLVHPARREAQRAAAAGEWPLWSPRMGAGQPLLADPQAQALQPITLVGEGPLEPTAGPGAVAAVRTVLALVFGFLLLRRLGAGTGPALAGSLAYGLGGFLQLWVGWPLANTAALLPAVLYALVLTSERGKEATSERATSGGLLRRSPRSLDRSLDRSQRRDWTLLVASLAALLLAGHPETVAYGLVVAGAFAVARWHRGTLPVGRGAWARRAAMGSVLALLVAAPALLPFAEVLPHTLRWERMAAGGGAEATAPAPDGADREGRPGRTLAPVREATDEPTGAERRPAGRLIQAVAPNAFGNSRFVHYWGLRNSNEDAAGFVGTATLLAALLAVAALAAAGLRRLAGRGSREAPAAGLRHELLALGLVAGTAVLLALPADLAARLPGISSAGGVATGAPGRLALVFDLGVAILAAGALERFRRGTIGRGLRWLGPPAVALALAAFHLWVYRAYPLPGAPETLDVLRRGWVHWHLRFAFLAAIALVAGAGRRWTAPAVAVLVAAELVLAHGPANPPAPERLAFPEVPVVRALQQGPVETGTTEPTPSSPPGTRIAGVGRVLTPNLAAVYGLGDVRVFSPMAPARYLRLLEPAIGGWYGEIPLLDGGEHPVLYDRLGVRWIVAAPESDCPEGTRATLSEGDGLLCLRTAPRPALTISGAPPRTLRAGAGGARWGADFGALLETGAGRLETAVAALPGWCILAAPPPGSDRAGSGRLQAREGGVGSTAEALLEADLPRGSARVDLLYRPAGFVAGLALAAIGLSLLLAWLVPPPR